MRGHASAAVARVGVAAMLAGCASFLSSCAVYHPKPLPTAPDLMQSPALTVPASSLGLPGLKPEPIDPSRGLTETNLVTLAVAANPLLKAERLRAGIARAQLLEAGLLPDPQAAVGFSKSKFTTGYSVVLAEYIQALIRRGAAKGAAAAGVRRVNLEILWREWQVAQRARQLYIRTQALRRLRGVLGRRRRLLQTLYHQDEAALQRHYVTISAVTADFAAWNSAEADWRSLERQDSRTRHALNELLGLEPRVRLRLRGVPQDLSITAGQYRAALAVLPRRRPDLLALQAGYRSKEERLREAILDQFPVISAGVRQSRGTVEGFHKIGFNVTLTLPLFNRNRGPIAIERATRNYLYQVYQARLDLTASEADQLWTAVRIMQHQLASLDARASKLERDAAAAEKSLERGTLSRASYARVDANALATRAAAIQLRAALDEARAALATLLARPF